MKLKYMEIDEKDYSFILELVYKNLDKVIKKSFKGSFNFDAFFKRMMYEGCSYIISYDEKACGFIWYTIRDLSLHVNSIVIDRKYQGKGIGSRVFDDLEDDAALRGLKYIQLGVQGVNKKAKKFYKKRGFIENSYIEEYDTFFMSKRI